MPAAFDQNGIFFEYPDNWQAETATDDEADISVTVYGPETAFWSLSRYPGTSLASQLADKALAAMQEEYPSLESEEASNEIEDCILTGYDLSFFYLDLCSSAIIRTFTHASTTFLLIYQAEDRELKQVEPVFQAMLVSLLRHLAAMPS